MPRGIMTNVPKVYESHPCTKHSSAHPQSLTQPSFLPAINSLLHQDTFAEACARKRSPLIVMLA